jgi:hypothetical protein
VGPPAQGVPVTRAAGIAVPPNQGSSSSLLEAVVGPPAQEGPVMRGLVTARRADPSDSPGSDSSITEEQMKRNRIAYEQRLIITQPTAPTEHPILGHAQSEESSFLRLGVVRLLLGRVQSFWDGCQTSFEAQTARLLSSCRG